MSASPGIPRAGPTSRRPDWLGARAALAGRRSGRFAAGAVATFVVVLGVLLVVPRMVPLPRTAAIDTARVDTIPLHAAADSARRAALHGDSLYDAAIFTSEYLADFDSTATVVKSPVDTVAPRRLRDSIRAFAVGADSALARARRTNAVADTHAVVVRERAVRRVPPVAILIAALVVAMITGFSVNLSAEIRKPTLATPREAERVTRAPILAVARENDRAPRIGGIDPFRMLYLGLTATGTRTRTVVITGDNREVTATVAGRLALAAAADARATLVVDADAEGSGVAAFYDDRPEPGFSDALAGVRLWREVTRSVGASDGLAIDVVPGGTVRREDADAAGTPARDEFARFRAEYDFCIIVAPSERSLLLASSLIDKAVTVLCAEVARTALERLRSDAAGVRMLGASLHGLAIWDAELPRLAARGTLMSKTLAAPARRQVAHPE